jgi:hypothetical protein
MIGLDALGLAVERLGDKREHRLRHVIVWRADLVVETLVSRPTTNALQAAAISVKS